ncbi:MAG: NADH:ubiquinone oxidoreductase [Bacteroidales bacterium]
MKLQQSLGLYLRKAEIPSPWRGKPVISDARVVEEAVAAVCPTGAISTAPLSIDLGRCAFCGECALAFPEKIKFTNNKQIYSNKRENLIIKEGDDSPTLFDPESVRSEIKHIFRKSLKIRQVSAGGDNSAEWELNASGNANFDMHRFGIEFVASPRHADGIVTTGPISSNMAEALRITYEATPDPKVIILAGGDAISGGIFSDSPALDRSFLDNHPVDLYIPGNPPHPLVIINALLDLCGRK